WSRRRGCRSSCKRSRVAYRRRGRQRRCVGRRRWRRCKSAGEVVDALLGDLAFVGLEVELAGAIYDELTIDPALHRRIIYRRSANIGNLIVERWDLTCQLVGKLGAERSEQFQVAQILAYAPRDLVAPL